MKSIINQLNQVQELILTRSDLSKVGSGESSAVLDKSLNEMMNNLAPEVDQVVRQLIDHDPIFMSPVHDDLCADCGMHLAPNLVQRVRQSSEFLQCPGCARILFMDEDASQMVSRADAASEQHNANRFLRYSDESLMLPGLVAGSAADAIEILASKMEAEGFITHAGNFISKALEREAYLSSAIGNGFAFPHVRGVEGGPLSLACGVSPEPFAWDSAGNRVSIVFLVAIPTAMSPFYSTLMAKLAETFLRPANRQALLAADTPAELWKALARPMRLALHSQRRR